MIFDIVICVVMLIVVVKQSIAITLLWQMTVITGKLITTMNDDNEKIDSNFKACNEHFNKINNGFAEAGEVIGENKDRLDDLEEKVHNITERIKKTE